MVRTKFNIFGIKRKAKTAHIFPDLNSWSKVSLRKLYDSRCTSKLMKKIKVTKNNNHHTQDYGNSWLTWLPQPKEGKHWLTIIIEPKPKNKEITKQKTSKNRKSYLRVTTKLWKNGTHQFLPSDLFQPYKFNLDCGNKALFLQNTAEYDILKFENFPHKSDCDRPTVGHFKQKRQGIATTKIPWQSTENTNMVFLVT